MFAIPLALALSVSWNFEGGSAREAKTVGPEHVEVRVAGQADQDGRNRQANWYFFEVKGASAGKPVTIDLIDLPGEYNYRANRGAVTGDTPAVWSEDGEKWTHVQDFEYDPKQPRMRLRVRPSGTRFWVAHTPPYTQRHLDRLWGSVSRVFERESIGKSVEGRDLWLWSAGTGPKTIWLMFRQHAWETGSSWAGEGVVREIAANAELRRGFTWKILPLCDPDGVARGGVRFNWFGYDLNRNWDVHGVEKMPEITAQRDAVGAWLKTGRKIDLLLTVHNTETSEYLMGSPSGEPQGVGLGQRLQGALEAGAAFAPSQPFRSTEASTTAGMPGRMTVVQGLWKEYQVPGFLMELRISKHPKLGRLPTVEDRLLFGKQLAGVLAKVLE